MSVSKKQKQAKPNTAQGRILFDYFYATNQLKHFKFLRENLKDTAVDIVDGNGGQIFLKFKNKNIHAKTKHKEYFTLDLERLKKEQPEIYSRYKNKVVNSITLEVNID